MEDTESLSAASTDDDEYTYFSPECQHLTFTPMSKSDELHVEESDSEARGDSSSRRRLTFSSPEPSPVFVDLTVSSDDDYSSSSPLPSVRRIKSETEQSVKYYLDDHDLPLYSQVSSPYNSSRLITILMNDSLGSHEVCGSRPLGVNDNATFIIDLDRVRFGDLKADDLGSWIQKGSKHTNFCFDDKGNIYYSDGNVSGLSYYTLLRRYYVHGTCPSFHRLIVTIEDGDKNLNVHAMVQYYFKGPMIPVLVKPHGNSSQGKPFFRTSESAKDEVRQLATKHTPSQAISVMTAQHGGELNIVGSSSVARDQMQVKNFRRTSTSKDTNALHAVMLECKLAQGKADAFVRDVKAAPELMAVCYCNWQIQDMKRFCTNPDEFTVMCADTTYNLGDFYVTPLSYKHLMLQDIRTGKPPLLPGPILVHQQVKFSSFNYFGSSLIDADKSLRYVQRFGTDGDMNLSDALSHCFPFAKVLRCFIHFERNLREKLRELNIPRKVADEFVRYVMGFCTGDTYQQGLVDCASISEFDQQLARLEVIWNEREKPFCGASEPRFYHYFKQHKADAVRYSMLTGVQESAGLGSLPSIFTTNMSESLNHILKQHMHYKASEWPEFNTNLKRLVDTKREEVIRALSGRGQYRLQPQYSHLGVDEFKWQRMRPDQRKKLVHKFDIGEFCPPENSTSINPKSTVASSVSTDVPCSQSQSCTHQSSGVSSSYHPRPSQLSVGSDDSGLNLHKDDINGMWEKAEKLVSMERGLQRAASSDDSAWSVQSFSSPIPHFVTSKDSGQFLCDQQCPQWVSLKICSHTLAVADKVGQLSRFLHWHAMAHQLVNVTSVGMLNMPEGRGQKGGVPKRKRTRKSVSEPEQITSRPSLTSTPSASLTTSAPHIESNIGPFSDTLNYYSPTYNYSGCPLGVPPTAPSAYPWFYPSMPPTNVSSPSTPLNPNPFYLKFIRGNIRTCQGCRGSLRASDSSIPDAPNDLCIARAEKRPYRDNSGNLITPATFKPSHYHVHLSCVRAAEPSFISTALNIPADVLGQLTSDHKYLINMQLGLQL